MKNRRAAGISTSKRGWGVVIKAKRIEALYIYEKIDKTAIIPIDTPEKQGL